MRTHPAGRAAFAIATLATILLHAAPVSAQQFTNVSASALPPLQGATEDAAFGDFDLDGDLDLVYSNGGSANQQSRLLFNQGLAQGGVLGVYADVTATRLLPNFLQAARDCATIDVDNDGDLDLAFSNNTLAANAPQGVTWFTNQGGAQGGFAGTFQLDPARFIALGSSESSVPGPLLIHGGNFAGTFTDWTGQCDFADVDMDGNLDFLASSYGPAFNSNVMSRLFLNAAGAPVGTLREYNPSGAVSGNPGLADGSSAGFAEGVQAPETHDDTGAFHDITLTSHDADFADFDNDFDFDLFETSQTNQSRIYQGRFADNGNSLGSEASGKRLFRDVTGSWLLGPGGLAQNGAGNYDNDFHDLDNDGDVDGMFNGYSNGVIDKWALNDGTGRMTNFQAMPNDNHDDNENDWIDIDNDGDVDALVAAFSAPDRFYKNTFVETGNTGFTYLPSIVSGVGTASYAADVGDCDNDGDPDAIFAQGNNTNEVLLKNNLNVPDPIAPRVTGLLQLAAGAPSSAPRVVVARAFDNINLEAFQESTATIQFSVDGVGHSAPARYSGGNLFRATIPGYWTGTIAYSVAVTDRQGNTGTSATKMVAIPQAGVSVSGAGVDGCAGPHAISTSSAPTLPNPELEIVATNAPPNAIGLLLAGEVIGSGADDFGIGVPMQVDLLASTSLFAGTFVTDPSGISRAAVPLPNAPAAVGATFHWMGIFAETACTVGPLNLSSTARLTTTFLP